jgi:Predicted transcriptional regulators
MDFQSRLKSLRTKHNMTQAELGKKINVTKVSVSGYETGNRTPDTDTLQRIAEVFEVSVDYLLCRTDDPSPTSNESKTAVEPGIYIAYLGGPPEEMDEVEAQHLKRELDEFRRFREERRKQMEKQKDE